jgi:hypothetical protein
MMGANIQFAGGNAAVLPFIIIIAVVLAVVIRLGAGSMDDGRIREYVEQLGGKIRSINWSPMGRGWFGSKNERIYEVVYEDAAGNVHQASCKTSALAGVYWTEDEVIESVQKPTSKLDAEQLASENRRLREEVERLKK